MVTLAIIAIISAAIAVGFLLYEIDQGLNAVESLRKARFEKASAKHVYESKIKTFFANCLFTRALRKLCAFPGLIIDAFISFRTAILDVILTFALVSLLSSAAGVIGTFISLTISGAVSMYIMYRKWAYNRRHPAEKAMEAGYEAVKS